MREVLRRLFAKSEPIRRFCEVRAPLPDGRYTVVDDLGREFPVDGDRGWLPGNKVIVQAGRIVSAGTRPPVKKTYIV